MIESQGFPWDVPLPPERTVGWVFRAGPGDPMYLWLRPGVEYGWSDARALGKEAGQPVLFLIRYQGRPTWAGWGHVLGTQERWRSFGVRTVCARPFDPLLEVVDASLDEQSVAASEELWENRALGTALGLLRYRDRTPYREVGARDFRLTSSDLRQLARVQPRLRNLVPFEPSIAILEDRESARAITPTLVTPSTTPSTADPRQAETIVLDDLKWLFGEELRFSSLKTTLGRFRGRDYWVVEGSFWSNFAPRNFEYAVTADTGELAAKRIDG